MARRPTRFATQPMLGDKLYQRRARQTLPILVRQAQARRPIYYQDLADELEMPNARNLNHVLGSIGTTLQQLRGKWGRDIPEIQALVINQRSHQPGTGYFGGEETFRKLPKKERLAQVQSHWDNIYNYPHWPNVLDHFGLALPQSGVKQLLEKARRFSPRGESEAHRRFKEAIAANPALVGLPRGAKCVATEHALPSGDKLDVFFQRGHHQFAVEVKSAISPREDILRGLFQCVKYRAVLEAIGACDSTDIEVNVILALEGTMPKELYPIRNTLQIKVVESIRYD